MKAGAPVLLIVGAGPAGMAAALAAADGGLRATVIDEFDQPGGQVFRAMAPQFLPKGKQPAEWRYGEALRRRFIEADIDYRPGHRAWLATPDLEIGVVGPTGNQFWRPDALLVATGAHERVVPFPGWTLPGVIGLAAATILLKADRIVPGGRTLVAGRGPLLAAVAAGIVKGGGTLAAVADANNRRDWLRSAVPMLSRPDQLLRGIGWLGKIAAAAPMHFGSRIARIEQHGGSLVAQIVDRRGQQRLVEADSIAVGDGLVPEISLTRLLGLKHAFDPLRGGWFPEADRDGRTTSPRIYVAGDGAGIAGAIVAEERGRAAGIAVLRDLGVRGSTRPPATARVRRAFGDAFASASRALMSVRDAEYAAIHAETIVCRCENITAGEVRASVAAGGHDANQAKAMTRAGMGPCQGRFCSAALARLTGDNSQPGTYTARAPARPVGLGALIGDYGYADIPRPPADPAAPAVRFRDWR